MAALKDMKEFQEAALIIKKSKVIAVGCHINPDGDTLGSLLALGFALKKMGKRVYMVSQDGVPKRYRFLYGTNYVKKSLAKKVDLAISVDCNSRTMIGRAYKTFQRANYIIEIDHHGFREPFGDLSLVNTKAAAVGELVYHLINTLKVEIDKHMAEAILTSIIVETNSFRLPNVNADVFVICSELVKKGVDFHRLADHVYWSKTKQIVLLSGVCLSRCKFEMNDRLVWSIVKRNDFLEAKGKDEDIDAVAEEMRGVKGVKISVLFREQKDGTLRVSLRSKGGINIASVANFYGGGGHFDVAGCFIQNKKSKIEELLREVRKLLK